MESNKRFSKEYIFRLVEMQRHAIAVNFKPSSESFEKYEYGISVKHVLSMDLETALHHMENHLNTYGVIKVKAYDNCVSPLNSVIIEAEFSTDEIDEIERL